MSKIKIHFFVPSLRGGGAQRVIVNLLRGLSPELFQPTLILAEKVGPYIDQVPPGVPVINLGVHHVRYALFKLSRYLRQERPDILFSVMGYANVIALLAQRLTGTPTKVLVSVHNTLSKRDRQNLRSKLVPCLERWLYPKANRVIAVSQGVKDDISSYLGTSREKITVIYNPVVNEKILELAQESIDHPWFCDKAVPIILAVGSLGNQKNYPLLFRAFKLIRASRSVRLVILGEGEERAHLENLAQKLEITNDVTLLGFQKNPYKFMAKASVFALSSLWEGLPTVLVEAMACGAPIVATNCPFGPSEIITMPKHNGLLVPSADPEALAKAILKVLEDKKLAMKLAKAGRMRARDFEVGKVAKQYEKLFHSILQEDQNESKGNYIRMYKKTRNKKYLFDFYNSTKYATGYKKIKTEWKLKFEIITSLMKLKPGTTVLDVGCASKMLKPFVENRNARYIGLDVSKKFNPDILADAEDLNIIRNNEYDWVVMSDVLEHLPNPERALREAHRVGKNIIAVVPNWYQLNCLTFLPSHPNDRHLVKKTPFGWIKLFREANFTIEFVTGFNYVPNLAFYPGLGLQRLSKLMHIRSVHAISDFIDKYLASNIFFRYLGQELITVAYKKE